MKRLEIRRVETEDRRFELTGGAGTDAVHNVTTYAFAVTRLVTGDNVSGCGIVLTLGDGNDVICQLISTLGELLPKCPIEELMAHFGDRESRTLGPR